jgi:hypothetical protein
LGGHYHSLLETVEQIALYHEVVIINVGNQSAKALENSKFKTYKVVNRGAALIKTNNQLKSILKVEKPDVLHAFDSLAFYWVRRLGLKYGIPFCLTKCGGINPVYYPYSANLILYSQENMVHFKSVKKFEQSGLNLIPNRIVNFPSDIGRIKEIEEQLGEYRNSFKFLRITRIGDYYHSSSLQLIELVRKLTAEGIKCCAIFVGTVENEKYLVELKEKADKNIFFFNEDRYAKNAKALIDCADAVMGTGRSFMEASSKGKVLLCPIKQSGIPLLVDENNFDRVFYFNFSERIEIERYAENENYDRLKLMLSKEHESEKLKKFSNRIFEEFFNANKIAEKHTHVYLNMKKPKRKYIDFFLHTLFLIRNYYR